MQSQLHVNNVKLHDCLIKNLCLDVIGCCLAGDKITSASLY